MGIRILLRAEENSKLFSLNLFLFFTAVFLRRVFVPPSQPHFRTSALLLHCHGQSQFHLFTVLKVKSHLQILGSFKLRSLITNTTNISFCFFCYFVPMFLSRFLFLLSYGSVQVTVPTFICYHSQVYVPYFLWSFLCRLLFPRLFVSFHTHRFMFLAS